MNLFRTIFKQRTARLVNGEVVREGDQVAFMNTDYVLCHGVISRRSTGSLYFWNIDYELTDYPTLHKTKQKP
jgi:hypothetical protein